MREHVQRLSVFVRYLFVSQVSNLSLGEFMDTLRKVGTLAFDSLIIAGGVFETVHLKVSLVRWTIAQDLTAASIPVLGFNSKRRLSSRGLPMTDLEQ